VKPRSVDFGISECARGHSIRRLSAYGRARQNRHPDCAYVLMSRKTALRRARERVCAGVCAHACARGCGSIGRANVHVCERAYVRARVRDRLSETRFAPHLSVAPPLSFDLR
jgi:hypothetical protein